jgi:hypothetical protein
MKVTSHRGVISLLGVLSLTGGALMLNGSGAGAATPKISDRCGALSASIATMTGKVSKCRSDLDHGVADATETNGSGKVTLSGSTATVTWNAPYEGSTTARPAKTVASLAFAPPNPDEPETMVCPANTTEENVTGTITADSTDRAGTDSDVGGKIVGEVCVNGAAGTLTLEPGSILAFQDPRGG